MMCFFLHRGLGTNEMLLIDCILTCSNEQIEQVKAAYKKSFLLPMQLRVDMDVSGKLQSNLDAVLNGKRPAHGIDQANVAADLEVLFKATEGKVGTDEKVSMRVSFLLFEFSSVFFFFWKGYFYHCCFSLS